MSDVEYMNRLLERIQSAERAIGGTSIAPTFFTLFTHILDRLDALERLEQCEAETKRTS